MNERLNDFTIFLLFVLLTRNCCFICFYVIFYIKYSYSSFYITENVRLFFVLANDYILVSFPRSKESSIPLRCSNSHTGELAETGRGVLCHNWRIVYQQCLQLAESIRSHLYLFATRDRTSSVFVKNRAEQKAYTKFGNLYIFNTYSVKYKNDSEFLFRYIFFSVNNYNIYVCEKEWMKYIVRK